MPKDEEPERAGHSGGPASEELPENVTEDIGGVQGSDSDANEEAGMTNAADPGAPDDKPAPDAGEIEWAGQVVKKPPTPGA